MIDRILKAAFLAFVAAFTAAMLFWPMPVYSASLAYVTNPDGSRIELHDDMGVCMADARHAVYIDAKGERVPGCWRINGARVLVVFVDGDTAVIPVQALSKSAPV